MTRTVFVTGASGFVGRHACEWLLRHGCRVRALVRDASAAPPGVEVVRKPDLADLAGDHGILDGVDDVLHLAARVHVLEESVSDPLAAFRRINVEGTRCVLVACERASVRRFLMISSVAALGSGGRGALRDSDVPRPATPYGISKLEAEQVLAAHCARTGLHGVVLRPPGIYGPGLKGNIPRLFGLIRRGVPFPAATGNRRSLVFVDNLLGAMDAAIDVASPDCPRFLVADDETPSTMEIARIAGRAMGRMPRAVPVPGPAALLAARMANAFGMGGIATALDRLAGSLVVEDAPLRDRTGYQPGTTFAEGLRITVQAYLASIPS